MKYHGDFMELKAVSNSCFLKYVYRKSRQAAGKGDNSKIILGYQVKPRSLDFIPLVIKPHPSV